MGNWAVNGESKHQPAPGETSLLGSIENYGETRWKGKTSEIKPETIVYAPPGITASHSWEIKEQLQLMVVPGTTDTEKTIPFDVDPQIIKSFVYLDHLLNRQTVNPKISAYSAILRIIFVLP